MSNASDAAASPVRPRRRRRRALGAQNPARALERLAAPPVSPADDELGHGELEGGELEGGELEGGELEGGELEEAFLEQRYDEPLASPRGEGRTRVAERAVVEVVNLYKSYHRGKHEVPVLRGVDLQIPRERLTVILGQSGSGKSTLLHLMGTLDSPDRGEIRLDGRRIDNLPAAAKESLRTSRFGMIFQFYHLLPELTTLENVLMPRMISDGAMRYWWRKGQYRERARELLDMVGLSHRLHHRPNQLSGGEMQRTAIARALICEPKVLFADEPTGNLDEATGRGILEILQSLNEQHKLTIVMVTHDGSVAQQADSVVRLANGKVQAELDA